jgi:TonB family protein
MKSRYSPLLVVAAVCLSGSVEHASAQLAQSPQVPHGGVVLTKLSDPTYPRLAQQARITGEVDLMLSVRRDGRVESVVVVGGHPMLKQAALDSAQRSQFECRDCRGPINSYSLRYKFQITPRNPPKDCDEHTEEKQLPAELDVSGHQVTVSAWEMWTCDPAKTVLRVRSVKCLYLWRCGIRDEN